jgi:hypothetical protein
MTYNTLLAATQRAKELRHRLRRHKLVFVQCGAAFEILREPLLNKVGGTVLDAVDFVSSTGSIDAISGPLVLTGLEAFARNGSAARATLGTVRKKVNELRDADLEICLFSRHPRIAYAPVPGSNLLEDTSPYCLPLLNKEECPMAGRDRLGFMFPSLGLDDNFELSRVFRDALDELGVNVLTALDFVVFEARLGPGFLSELDAGVKEALRGAGFGRMVNDELEFVDPQLFRYFEDAIADVMANIVSPQNDLADISEGIWLIERTIRRALRDAAIARFGAGWRKSVLNEAVGNSVLGRARRDVNVTAVSVAELRDPIEWLSLGELLEVVQSNVFSGLALDNMSWKRFAQDILPVRNRLSHMRLLKKGDKATVRMWVNRIEKFLG